MRFGHCSNPDEVSRHYSEWTGKQLETLPQDCDLLVATDNGKVLGCLQLIIIDNPVWQTRWGLIENVYVVKEHRRKDIGRKLMRYAEEYAKSLGCSFVKLTSKKREGKALYRSLGYEEGSSFYRNL